MRVKTCCFLLLHSYPLFPSPHSHSFPFLGFVAQCYMIVGTGIDVVIFGMLTCTEMGWILIVGGSGKQTNNNIREAESKNQI